MSHTPNTNKLFWRFVGHYRDADQDVLMDVAEYSKVRQKRAAALYVLRDTVRFGSLSEANHVEAWADDIMCRSENKEIRGLASDISDLASEAASEIRHERSIVISPYYPRGCYGL